MAEPDYLQWLLWVPVAALFLWLLWKSFGPKK